MEGVIQHISSELQELNFPLIGSAERWWVNELLFQPGIHRFQLIRWILTKLDYNVLNESEPPHSPDEHGKSLLQALSDLGFCSKLDSHLVFGTASQNEQIRFWKMMLDVLSAKIKIQPKITSNNMNSHLTDPGSVEASLHKSSIQDCFEEEFNRNTWLISKWSSKVNINDLFIESETLFSADVERDTEQTLSVHKSDLQKYSIPDVKALKQIVRNSDSDHSTLSKSVLFSDDVYIRDEFSLLPSDEANLVDSISAELNKVADNAVNFNRAYRELEPVLQPTEHNFSDVGPAFECLHHKLDQFTQLISNLTILKTTALTLDSQLPFLEKYAKDNRLLSNSNLADYITMLEDAVKRLDSKLS